MIIGDSSWAIRSQIGELEITKLLAPAHPSTLRCTNHHVAGGFSSHVFSNTSLGILDHHGSASFVSYRAI